LIVCLAFIGGLSEDPYNVFGSKNQHRDTHTLIVGVENCMKYRALVFDLDGTLVDSFSAIHQSLVKAMHSAGDEPWDLKTTKMHVGWGFESLLEKAVGPAKRDAALDVFREQYARICLSKTYLLPSVSETLQQFQDRGYRMAVATNKHSDFSSRILRHLGMFSYFLFVLGPNDVVHPKPHPDMLEGLMKRMDVERSETLYIGDMPLDVKTASHAEVDCLLVATGPYSLETLSIECNVPVVAHFADILDYLKAKGSHSRVKDGE
jgi:phosphoglycolate phosphatase-like HAD superfamily hydrolase